MDKVSKTESIASTPKDGRWYVIPSHGNTEHYINWNSVVGKWQSMLFVNDVPPTAPDWIEDGAEIAGVPLGG